MSLKMSIHLNMKTLSKYLKKFLLTPTQTPNSSQPPTPIPPLKTKIYFRECIFLLALCHTVIAENKNGDFSYIVIKKW